MRLFRRDVEFDLRESLSSHGIDDAEQVKKRRLKLIAWSQGKASLFFAERIKVFLKMIIKDPVR